MQLEKSTLKPNVTLQINGSKSISNRLLILDHLFGNLLIENLSDSQDTQILKSALNTDSTVIDIHHAGTAMRFLTAYFAIQDGRTVLLTGSDRMKQRPIKFLVDALRELGADISYTETEGFPPLKITGKKLQKNSVRVAANISSQFISALMLIGGSLENGLEINLKGEITSRPYLEMTLKILKNTGICSRWRGNRIQIFSDLPQNKNSLLQKFVVESDWSSASYFYSLAAIGKQSINLQSFRPHSLQGDSVLKEIYWENFGVNTISEDAESRISLYRTIISHIPKKSSWR